MRTLFALLCLLLTAVVPAAGLDDADTRLFLAQKALAEKGDKNAQYYLGEMYENGLGTPASLDDAFHWYGIAAAQSHRLARRKLASRAEIEKQASPGSPPPTAQVPAVTVPLAPGAAPVNEAQKAERRARVRKMVLEQAKDHHEAFE